MTESTHTSITSVMGSSFTQRGQEQQVARHHLALESSRDPLRSTINQNMTSLPDELNLTMLHESNARMHKSAAVIYFCDYDVDLCGLCWSQIQRSFLYWLLTAESSQQPRSSVSKC